MLYERIITALLALFTKGASLFACYLAGQKSKETEIEQEKLKKTIDVLKYREKLVDNLKSVKDEDLQDYLSKYLVKPENSNTDSR